MIIINGAECNYCKYVFYQTELDFEDELIQHLENNHPEMKALDINIKFTQSELEKFILGERKQ